MRYFYTTNWEIGPEKNVLDVEWIMPISQFHSFSHQYGKYIKTACVNGTSINLDFGTHHKPELGSYVVFGDFGLTIGLQPSQLIFFALKRPRQKSKWLIYYWLRFRSIIESAV